MPWCYTTNATARWEYCTIPSCDGKEPDSPGKNNRRYLQYGSAVSLCLVARNLRWLLSCIIAVSLCVMLTDFYYSLQLLISLSKLKQLRSATKAMVWVIVVQLLSLSQGRNVKPGTQCHHIVTIKLQNTSQMRMCISYFCISFKNDHSWTHFYLQHLYTTMIWSWEGDILVKSPLFSFLFLNLEVFQLIPSWNEPHLSL